MDPLANDHDVIESGGHRLQLGLLGLVRMSYFAACLQNIYRETHMNYKIKYGCNSLHVE